ncbi:VWA domain-containing protein [Deltaproteobacteria bacterium TL4]
MRFDAPWALLLLLLLPFLLYGYYRLKGRGSLKFSSTAHAKRVKPSLKQRLIAVPVILRILVLIFLVLTIARPQEGKEKVRDISQGIAIEMVVDRSGSMSAEMEFENQNLNRLDVVKRVFEEFVTGKGGKLPGRSNDLIGMIAFARYADTVAPLTLAHGALSQFIDNVQLVKRRDEEGTAIGDAIALASARLQTAEKTMLRQAEQQEKNFEIKSKIIILLTDGQNNVGKRDPVDAAKMAKEWGIKIYTIGVGGSEGMTRQQGLLGNFLMRMGGAGVDEKMLTSIADTTGGIFRTADDADSLRAIYKEIDALERSEIQSVRYLDYREQFLPFLLITLSLLTLEMILSNTVFRKIP